MGFLINIALSTIVGMVSAIGVYTTIPLSFIEKFSIDSGQKLGSSITTIAGGDTISSSRAVINTNFSNLNDGKIENSTTSVAAITTLSNLVTVGTLTSGSLGSGFTTVVGARGGTGSTTLSTNQVLLGNGTGNIGVVEGWGTSGQGLLSNGGVLAPTWQAITTDQTANYIWSGTHTFNNRAVFSSSINATGTTLIQQLNASSTAANPIVLNGVSLSTPPTQGASSTVLKNNGSGSLIWDSANATGTSFFTTGTSTWLVPTGISRVKVSLQGAGGGGGGSPNDTGRGAGGGGGAYAEAWVDVTAATGIQFFVGLGGDAGPASTNGVNGSSTVFYATSTRVTAGGGAGGAGGLGAGNGSGGAGGTATNAGFSIAGSAGYDGGTFPCNITSGGGGGDGGESAFGDGGCGANSGAGRVPRFGYGGGGGGGGQAAAGGAGDAGYLKIEWIE